MDDWLNLIKNNLKVVIFSLLGLVVFSVLIGVILGLIAKPNRVHDEEGYQILSEMKKAAIIEEEAKQNQKVTHFLIPPPVDFDMEDIFKPEYSDELLYLLDSLKLRPIKISDLINERTMGENATVKPVIFDNEEKGILTLNDEIIEP
ncbi:MAG: hypothetical protein DRP84_06890 [Spirochaetes bacterium]|nr:MAG: hypothetical protein DRP84_06890 [Spirochaetota bacterium]RKY00801.1 MAG: hypothetical protein DRP55_05230 [Spirochaetota bacterium]